MLRQLGEIAELLKAELTGDPTLVIRGINDLGRAEPDQLAFLGNPRYIKQALESKAGAIIIPRDSTAKVCAATLRVDNPSTAFAKVAALYAPLPIPWLAGIHPTSVVDTSAQLGAGVHIGPHAVVEPGVIIGDGVHVGAGGYVGHDSVLGDHCFMHPRVTLRERSKLGKRVIMHSGVVIGSDGFGYEFSQERYVKVPQLGYVQIDDDVEIGSNSTIDRGRFDKTWIQEGCKIDNLVMIAHNVVIGAHSIIVAQVGISGSASLGKYNTIGGQSAIVGQVRIADKVSVTGWSAVTKDLTEAGVYRGGPAKPMRENMQTEALIQKLPEIYARLKVLEAAAKKED
jgi:UDP-3-O-[3-hydroxymyristoyl] glucosamine N-acyltransferase